MGGYNFNFDDQPAPGAAAAPPNPPAPPSEGNWASDEDLNAIQQEFETLLEAKVAHVEGGGKQLAGEEVHRLFDLIGLGVTRIQANGYEWTARLVEGDKGENFATVLGALKYGAIKETMHQYIRIFLDAKGLTWEGFLQQVNQSKGITAVTLLGFGRSTSVYNKLRFSVTSFPGNEENVPPSNLFPSPVNPDLTGTDLFGAGTAPQGTPFPNSNSAAPAGTGTVFPNSQGQGGHRPAGASKPGRGQNGGTAAPPGGGGLHVNTNAPPAFVATSADDPSVASNVTQPTFGAVSLASAPVFPSAGAKAMPPPSVSAPTATPTSKVASGVSVASAPAVGTAKRAPVPRRFQTPKYNANGLTRRPLNTGHRDIIRPDNQAAMPTTPALQGRERGEIRKLVGTAKRGVVPIKDATLDLDREEVKAEIEAPDKALHDDLMQLREGYHDDIQALSDRRKMEAHFERIADTDPEYFYELKYLLKTYERHQSTYHHRLLLEEEKGKVRDEQEEISRMANDITKAADIASAQAEQDIKERTYEAKEKKKELQRQIEKVDRDLEEYVETLRSNDVENKRRKNSNLELLEQINEELKSGNASRLAMSLALERNDIMAMELLSKAINIRDRRVETNEDDEVELEEEKEAFFQQQALIGRGDVALMEQAMEILYA